MANKDDCILGLLHVYSRNLVHGKKLAYEKYTFGDKDLDCCNGLYFKTVSANENRILHNLSEGLRGPGPA